ncbi:MAG TPA: hypothetical protein VGC32_06555 [Solirubrobacterales bacterium]
MSIGVLAVAACAALPAAASAAPPSASTSLVFTTGTARPAAGLLAVPVRCLGESTGFCSGVLTLTSGSRKASIPFSVKGGSTESIYVPLRLEGTRRASKVTAVAATAQPLGPPDSVTEVLSVR